MFSVLAALLTMLKNVFCHAIKRLPNVCQVSARVPFPACLPGVRPSEYPGFKEKRDLLSFFFVTYFGRSLLCQAKIRFEFRLSQSQIETKGFAAHLSHLRLGLIQPVSMGIFFSRWNLCECRESLLQVSISLFGLRHFFCVLIASQGPVLA